MSVLLYTDGACSGNPGPGGYGLVLIFGELRKEASQGFRMTTNNRMELLAVIIGLESLKKVNSVVTVYSDSSYVVNAVNKKWLFAWEKNNYKKRLNPDLWKRFLIVYRKHIVVFKWVKGHAGNIENERCDELAVKAISLNNLSVDIEYEKASR